MHRIRQLPREHDAIKAYRLQFCFDGFLGRNFLTNFKRTCEPQEEQKHKQQTFPTGYDVGLGELPSL